MDKICSVGTFVLSLDKIPSTTPLRTGITRIRQHNAIKIPDSCPIRTPYSYPIRTPCSYPIRTPYSYPIRTPCSNVVRTEYPKGGRTPDSLRIKVYRKEKVPQIFRFAGP